MKIALITIIFTLLAVYISRTLDFLQFKPARLQAFVSIAFVSILLLSQPRLAFYLAIASVSFYDPRYWWGFLRLWLHQWIILFSIILFIGIRIQRREKFVFYPLDLWLGGLILTFLISTLNSPDPGTSVRWTIYFLILIGGYYLARLTIDSSQQLIRVTWFLLLCGAVSGGISIFRPTVGSRVGSLVLSNPNALGNYLALILPLPLAFLFYGRLSPVRKAISFLAITPIAVSLILTLSRSSWVGSGVGLLALGCFRPRLKYFIAVLAGLSIVFFIPAVQSRIFEDRDDPGISYRRTKITIAYEMFKEAPILGHGPGSFQALAPEQDEWGVVAHSAIENLYLRMLAEGGLLQSAVFFGLIVYFSVLGWSTLQTLPPGPLQAVVLGSLAAFWASLGIGIGEDILLFPMNNWLIGFYLAVVIKAREFTEMGIIQESPVSSGTL
ncbi:MAG: O-antigen ligase family protein [Candidatus Erginobacter occultus]|nr:O-antigen ligase family protein [Candidatus Erginobacter occultus]